VYLLLNWVQKTGTKEIPSKIHLAKSDLDNLASLSAFETVVLPTATDDANKMTATIPCSLKFDANMRRSLPAYSCLILTSDVEYIPTRTYFSPTSTLITEVTSRCFFQEKEQTAFPSSFNRWAY
jgi:hypothetical protein